jgi:hypothetical protein
LSKLTTDVGAVVRTSASEEEAAQQGDATVTASRGYDHVWLKALLAVAVLLALVVLGFVVTRRGHSVPVRVEGTGETTWVDPKSLKMGPIREKPLTPEQLQRIQKLHQRLESIDGWSLEKRVDLFSRDLNPDQEISICERIVDASERAFATLGPLTAAQKLEVYGLLVVASGAPAAEVLKRYTPKTITPEQAKVALSVW